MTHQLPDLVSKIQAYNPKADTELVAKAYHFAVKAHEGQVRHSGQPFVTHPLEVALILADMKLDTASIVAGMLHDVLEDTDETKETLAHEFGNDIGELVDGVTKLSKLQFNTSEERQAETFRKMILAMSKDIRVILIKLADRLHNLRTLQFMPEEKQRRIAQETEDIYAKLANRLGIDWLKNDLEDLSFRFLKPDIARSIEKKMAGLKKNREEYIHRVEEAVKDHFKNSIKNFEIKGRLKHLFSIYNKMERQNITFEQVHDVMAFRILTNTVEECYEALGLLHSLWKPVPGRFKDYIAIPKANHYQSVHTTVVCLDGQRVEFQLRTFEMHETADKGIAAHWKYKDDGQIDMKGESTFQWLRQLTEWQTELKDSLEFMDTVKLDLFPSEIFVFTPKGDVRSLPYGSTPIDFAFAIHSDVGLHCAGAKIGGKIVPLSTELHNGDEVEIKTDANHTPNKDWLRFVKSSRAKAKIRQFLKQEQREKSIQVGKKLFEQTCSEHHTKPEDVFHNPIIQTFLKNKGIPNEASFYTAIAYGKISLPSLLAQITPSDKNAELKDQGVLKQIFKKVSQQTKDLVFVEGLDEILVRFSRCCSPIKGDPIVGFITRGRGVTIHRTECPKVPAIDPERRVNASWNQFVDIQRVAKIRIVCESKTGMLANIAHSISEKHINITKVVVHTTKDLKAIIFMELTVASISELYGAIQAIEKLKGVISVERQVEEEGHH